MYEPNLAAIERYFPNVAEKLLSKTVTPLERIKFGDGWDVMHDNKPFYGVDALTYSKNQVTDFWNSQDGRIYTNPPDRENLDDVTNAFYSAALRRATESGVTFFANRADLRSYYAIVLGIGLAEHLPMLAGLTQCRRMIVVERDPALLEASMHTFDWVGFISMFQSKKGHRFDLALMDEPDEIYRYINELINFHPNPTFIDGLCIFQHYESAIFTDAINRLVAAPETLISGFGFLFDNLNMVQNNYFNLRDCNAKIFNSTGKIRRLPAFIIGAGPSIDNDIEIIRRYADQAIIITCGSSIPIMLENGITPDVHVELENVPEALKILTTVANNHDLRTVRLVASTTVNSGIPKLFEKAVFFFRKGNAPYYQFCTGINSEIHNAGPTVANLGVALAGELGCDQIFLFGVDLGTFNPERHHATDTAYMQGEQDYEWFRKYQKQEGNFGGQIFTNEIYLRSRDQIANVARRFADGQKIFNCSNGLMIPGIASSRPESLPVKSLRPEEKKVELEKIFSEFPKYDLAAFAKAWNAPNRQAANIALKDRLTGILHEHNHGYEEVLNGLMRLSDEVMFSSTSMERHIYRGSLIHAIMAAYFFMSRTGNANDRLKFAEIISEEMENFIDSLSNFVSELYEGLRDPETATLMPFYRNDPRFKS